MEQVDVGSLSVETQEALRKRAVKAVVDGIPQHEAADRLVSRAARLFDG